MPRNPDPLHLNHEVSNDPLGTSQTVERSTWGLPSDEGLAGQHPAELPHVGFDYSGGVMVARPRDANDLAPPEHPHLIRAHTDAPATFDLPHEATHRRYEPPKVVPIAQTAAGYLVVASTQLGLHYVKLLALHLTLDAAGTIKFVQGPNDGTGVSATAGPADLTGLMAMGGGAAPPLNLPPAPLQNPWLFTSPDQSLGIFTVTGKAAGWALVAYSPYDN